MTIERMIDPKTIEDCFFESYDNTEEILLFPLQRVVCNFCIPIIWGNQPTNSPDYNQNFLSHLPEGMAPIYAERTARDIIEQINRVPIPADALRKALSFVFHAYSEHTAAGQHARKLIQYTANKLGIAELTSQEIFYQRTAIFDHDADDPFGRTQEKIPLPIAIHIVLNSLSIPSSWLLQGFGEPWKNIEKLLINPNYLQNDKGRSAPPMHYYIARAKWAELCTTDSSLFVGYRNEVQQAFSHVYHMLNDKNETGIKCRKVVKDYLRTMGIPVLPLEALERQEFNWQTNIQNGKKTPYAKTH